MFSEKLGQLHLVVRYRHEFSFLPMHFLGLAGMPRRIQTMLQFTDFNQLCTIGAFIFGFLN